MKRKVIQIADSTQLISLPRQWGKKYNIKKGDELEIVEKDNMLEIWTKVEDKSREITLDISGLDRTSIFFVLRSAYQQGYDVIKVKFDNKTTVHYRAQEKVPVSTLLHQELKRWVGMQIIEQKENYFVYKSISKASFDEFDGMFRRIFLLLMDSCDELIKALEKKEFILLETMDEKFYNVLLFIIYCQRLLNKIGFSEKYKNSVLYSVLINFNVVGDVLRYTSRDILKIKNVHAQTVGLLKKIFESLRLFYDLFYKFDFEKVTFFYKYRDEVIRQIDSMKRTVPVEELIILVYCRQMVDTLITSMKTTATYYLEEQTVNK